MMKKVKWGIIGSEGIARRRTIPEGFLTANNAALVAVQSRSSTLDGEASHPLGVKRVESIESLLKQDIDAVYIATPPYLHLEQTLACAKASKHVFCEKPLGLTIGESEAMARACSNSGVLLGTAFMMRFHPQHQEALRLIQEEKLGHLVFGRAQLSCWYPPIKGAWRQNLAQAGGGALMDLGCHCIDLMEMFFGRIVSVQSLMSRIVHDYPVEDSSVTSLSFENKALAVVDAFFCIPDECSHNTLELYGSKGAIVARGTIGQGEQGIMVARFTKNTAGYDAHQVRQHTPETLIAPSPINVYRAEIEEFSQAIIEGRSSSNSATLGIRSQKVLAACYQSAATGSRVYLSQM